jgi:hypothetical protein
MVALKVMEGNMVGGGIWLAKWTSVLGRTENLEGENGAFVIFKVT